MEGWRITLLYLWLPTPEDALERVATRVAGGGHGVAPEIVVRRYWAGLKNLRRFYLPLADIAAIYDNSDKGRVSIAEKTPESGLILRDPVRWAAVQGARP
ncbi:MAG TPA: hypothetical protein VMU93_01845 [Caulobacteraceae bacterium]|nr:hypothetical protein [Caulobacteraceae bacterium]